MSSHVSIHHSAFQTAALLLTYTQATNVPYTNNEHKHMQYNYICISLRQLCIYLHYASNDNVRLLDCLTFDNFDYLFHKFKHTIYIYIITYYSMANPLIKYQYSVLYTIK